MKIEEGTLLFPQDTVVIGDSAPDIGAATSAGMAVIAVPTEYSTAKVHEAEKALSGETAMRKHSTLKDLSVEEIKDLSGENFKKYWARTFGQK